MKILLDFNVKFGREVIFKQTIGNESLHQDNNDNCVRIVKYVTSNNLVVKKYTMFNTKTFINAPETLLIERLNQIGHMLIKRWHSSILDVRCFRGTDCDTDQYLVVVIIKEMNLLVP